MSGLNAVTGAETAPHAVPPPAVFVDRDLHVVFASGSARLRCAEWADGAAPGDLDAGRPLRLPPEVLRACMRLGALLEDRAGGSEATQATVRSRIPGLTATVEICESCADGEGATGFLVHFFAASPPITGRSGDAGIRGPLSPSEEEVARLVAMGRSNRAVARELCKSERTVECQLSAIYRKLGVVNRVQLCRTLLAAAQAEGFAATAGVAR